MENVRKHLEMNDDEKDDELTENARQQLAMSDDENDNEFRENALQQLAMSDDEEDDENVRQQLAISDEDEESNTVRQQLDMSEDEEEAINDRETEPQKLESDEEMKEDHLTFADADLPDVYADTPKYYEDTEEVLMTRLPPFVRIESHVFDSNTYKQLVVPEFEEQADIEKEEAERREEAILEAQRAIRLIPATIRWRYHPETGQRESNARFVRWDDGSLSLLIGNKFYEARVQPVDMQREHTYLCVHHPGIAVLEAVDRVRTRLQLQPSLESKQESHTAHPRVNELSSAVPPRTRQVKLTATTMDPEKQKAQMLQAEKEALSARRRLQQQRRRGYDDDDELGAGVNNRHRLGVSSRTHLDDDGTLNKEDLEADDDEDDEDAHFSRKRVNAAAAEDDYEMDGFVVDDDEVEEVQESETEEESERDRRRKRNKKAQLKKHRGRLESDDEESELDSAETSESD